MPEGPEIRIAADKLAAALVGTPALDVFFAFERLKRFQKRLAGHCVRDIETRGKALLTHFDNGLSIYSHNQLYGRWMVRRAHDFPNSRRQLRLAIHTSKRSALLYSASDIDVLTATQIASHPYLSKLGPDVLSADAAQLLDQLNAERFAKRRLGSLLLDQHFYAGVGNYLRSEILFVANLHPRLRPRDCSNEARARLADVAIALARQSYLHNGVTNDLEDAARLKSQGQPRGRYRHWVFDRRDRPCRRCGTRIVHDIAASRRIYFCPSCQALPPSGR